jgi:hypothetical protein
VRCWEGDGEVLGSGEEEKRKENCVRREHLLSFPPSPLIAREKRAHRVGK